MAWFRKAKRLELAALRIIETRAQGSTRATAREDAPTLADEAASDADHGRGGAMAAERLWPGIFLYGR
jgi:hypothetical protein